LARNYKQGDGDCGICFEYAVHDAIRRGEASVMERVNDGLIRCKIKGGDPSSILFGAEKSGSLQLIKTASELLTEDSRLLAGTRGQPCKLKRHIESVASALKRSAIRHQLPWSIGGLWKADLFLGRTAPDQWVGTTVKINRSHLEAARGLRVAIVPATQGKSDAIITETSKNLIVCPVPYDAAFMETFYCGWEIVQSFLAADAQVPKEVALPRPAARQVARYLADRRDYPVLDVIDALSVLAQPELLVTASGSEIETYDGIDATTTGAVLAPVPLTTVK
jgi:hypothetical protein